MNKTGFTESESGDGKDNGSRSRVVMATLSIVTDDENKYWEVMMAVKIGTLSVVWEYS